MLVVVIAIGALLLLSSKAKASTSTGNAGGGSSKPAPSGVNAIDQTTADMNKAISAGTGALGAAITLAVAVKGAVGGTAVAATGAASGTGAASTGTGTAVVGSTASLSFVAGVAVVVVVAIAWITTIATTIANAFIGLNRTAQRRSGGKPTIRNHYRIRMQELEQSLLVSLIEGAGGHFTREFMQIPGMETEVAGSAPEKTSLQFIRTVDGLSADLKRGLQVFARATAVEYIVAMNTSIAAGFRNGLGFDDSKIEFEGVALLPGDMQAFVAQYYVDNPGSMFGILNVSGSHFENFGEHRAAVAAQPGGTKALAQAAMIGRVTAAVVAMKELGFDLASLPQEDLNFATIHNCNATLAFYNRVFEWGLGPVMVWWHSGTAGLGLYWEQGVQGALPCFNNASVYGG